MESSRIRIDWSKDQYCISCPKLLVPNRRGLRAKDLAPGVGIHAGKGRCYSCSRGYREGYIPRVDPLFDTNLTCNDCDETLDKQDFEYHSNGRRYPACRQCSSLKYYYKLTKAQYTELLEAQGYCCAICKKDVKDIPILCIDHDHSCCPTKARSCGECVRGLLCSKCNKGIGLLEDDIDTLKSAIEYLQAKSKAPIGESN